MTEGPIFLSPETGCWETPETYAARKAKPTPVKPVAIDPSPVTWHEDTGTYMSANAYAAHRAEETRRIFADHAARCETPFLSQREEIFLALEKSKLSKPAMLTTTVDDGPVKWRSAANADMTDAEYNSYQREQFAAAITNRTPRGTGTSTATHRQMQGQSGSYGYISENDTYGDKSGGPSQQM